MSNADKKLRVLAIVQTLSVNTGAGRLSRKTILGLRELNDVRILSEVDSDISIEKTLLKPRSSLGAFISNCFLARKAARDCSVVHAFDAWPYGVYALFAVVGTRKRLIISGIGTYSVAPLFNRSSKHLVRMAYLRATAIPCISRYTQQRILKEVPSARTVVVHLGTTLLPNVSDTEIESFRTKLSIPGDAYPVVITVGEIKDRKGQRDTLAGLISLKEKYPNFLYVIVGSDRDVEYVESIKALAQEAGVSTHVKITTKVSTDKDLSCVYQLSHLQMLLSNNEKNHFEGFGLVLLEGAQFGLPALGSAGCGIEDAINDGVSGILIPQKDTAAVTRGIEKILDNYASFQAGAREWYTHFSWDNSVQEIQKLYE